MRLKGEIKMTKTCCVLDCTREATTIKSPVLAYCALHASKDSHTTVRLQQRRSDAHLRYLDAMDRIAEENKKNSTDEA